MSQEEFAKIDAMGHEEMARLYRFAPAGHPYFNMELPYWDRFMERFKSLGGMTPEISKRIGWKSTEGSDPDRASS